MINDKKSSRIDVQSPNKRAILRVDTYIWFNTDLICINGWQSVSLARNACSVCRARVFSHLFLAFIPFSIFSTHPNDNEKGEKWSNFTIICSLHGWWYFLTVFTIYLLHILRLFTYMSSSNRIGVYLHSIFEITNYFCIIVWNSPFRTMAPKPLTYRYTKS